MKKSTLIITIIILGVFIAGYMYSKQGTQLPFKSIIRDQNESIFDLHEQREPFYSGSEPKIMLVPGSRISELDALIPTQQKEQLYQLSVESDVLVAAFQGTVAQSPHGIEIQNIVLDEQTLFVHVFMHTYADVVSPGGGTSDFEVVALDRSALSELNDPLNVYMLDQNGDTIASTTLVLE